MPDGDELVRALEHGRDVAGRMAHDPARQEDAARVSGSSDCAHVEGVVDQSAGSPRIEVHHLDRQCCLHAGSYRGALACEPGERLLGSRDELRVGSQPRGQHSVLDHGSGHRREGGWVSLSSGVVGRGAQHVSVSRVSRPEQHLAHADLELEPQLGIGRIEQRSDSESSFVQVGRLGRSQRLFSSEARSAGVVDRFAHVTERSSDARVTGEFGDRQFVGVLSERVGNTTMKPESS